MRVNKVIIIFIFLLLTIAAATFFLLPSFRKAVPLPVFRAVKKTVVLKLNSEVDKSVVAQPFKLFLYFTSENTDISSFDAVVTYDPEMVQVDEIRQTDVFPFYPRKMIEDFKSRFVITGVQQSLKSELKVKNGELAQISVTPLREGSAEFNFLVDGDKYTNVMNRALENVLQNAVGTTVEITE